MEVEVPPVAIIADAVNAHLEPSDPPGWNVTLKASINRLNDVQAINETLEGAKRSISAAAMSAAVVLEERATLA